MAYRLLARFDDQTIRTTLHRGRNTIGSDAGCEVCLPNSTVSRRHAAVRREAKRVVWAYRWRLALCAGCHVHLGWHYSGGAPFFGLILDRLVEGEADD